MEEPRETLLIHHSTLYYQNGDIVISASRSTKPHEHKQNVLFRVHKFLLSHNSPVFADMLTTHNAPMADEENMYDGVDLVVVPDEADDFAKLLLYTYEPSSFPTSKYTASFALDMFGVMALAVKYDFNDLRQRIVQRFKEDWPTNAYAWGAWIDQSEAARVESNKDRSEHNLVNLHWPEPASAIRFARAYDVHSVLPAAFYRLCMIQPEVGWDEYPDISPPWDDRLLARWNLLSTQDLMIVIKLRRRCSQMMEQMPSSLNCMICRCDTDGCMGSLQELWTVTSASCTGTDADPLQAFHHRSWNKNHLFDYRICSELYVRYRREADAIREGIWAGLTSFVLGEHVPLNRRIYL